MSLYLSKSLQENILTLLCFNDDYATMVRSVTDQHMFEGVYHPLVTAAFRYIDEYQAAPKQHLSEVLEYETDEEVGKFLKRTLVLLFENNKDLNAERVAKKLSIFIDQQTTKEKIIELNDLILSDNNPDKDLLDEVYNVMSDILKSRHLTFEPGLNMGNQKEALGFMEKEERDVFSTGILELDKLGLGPAREELFVFMALLNKGKTWFLTQLGKRAIMERAKVLHITLEVSEQIMAKRYLQTFFGFTTQETETWASKFILSNQGELSSVKQRGYKPEFTLKDEDAYEKLKKKFELANVAFARLRIKRFPTGMLTFNQLTSYLDMLERSQNFIPDIIIIDYVELMDIPVDNYRMQLGKMYTKLRGLAVERNASVVTVSQSNRSGVSASVLTAEHVGEDFSKFQTADNVISYTQAEQEAEMKLARLYVLKARNTRANDMFLISQNYDTGQFCIASLPYKKSYGKILTGEPQSDKLWSSLEQKPKEKQKGGEHAVQTDVGQPYAKDGIRRYSLS